MIVGLLVGMLAGPFVLGRVAPQTYYDIFGAGEEHRALLAFEERAADAIVVWKWSRLARNRRDWAVAVDTIEAAGGRPESSTETVDTITSTGRLARGMLAEIAAFESDRIGDGWREAHAPQGQGGPAGER